MKEFIYWLLRIELIALSVAICRLVWLESRQAFEKEINQLRQQLARLKNEWIR